MNDIDREKWDVHLYSGQLYLGEVEQFFASLSEAGTFKPNLSLVLTTYGGDPHSAYKLSRFVRNLYQRVRLVVAGPCKSAGTLIALGADEIAFGPFGELGPLDVQLSKKDELMSLSSGLDTLQTFGLIAGYAYSTFESYMLQTVMKSRGGISTKTACEIASQLTTGLFAPLVEQIDPHVLSEVQRKMAIAKAYGERLRTPNVKPDAVDSLIHDYPSHGFIIDAEEAGELFEEVTQLHPSEFRAVLLAEKKYRCAMSPGEELVVEDLWRLLDEEDDDDKSTEGAGRSLGSNEPHEGGEPSNDEPSDAEIPSDGRSHNEAGPQRLSARKKETHAAEKGPSRRRAKGKRES